MTTQSSAPPALSPPHPGRLAPPPGRAGVIPRTRLLQRFVSVAQAPVFLVAAPAGYGKSTLLAQVAQAEGREVAWLSLDEGDDDPTVLLHDLAYALSATGSPDEDLLARLLTGPAGVVPVALPRLIALLHERAEPLVIVLDDVHVLRSAGALDVLQSLCVDAPAGCAVVLAGRTRPDLPLARLRASGRLSELRAADLRMTAGEGAGALRAAGIDVDERESAIVVRQTEGWPAAVYLAALMLRADDGPGGVSRRFLETDVAEYVRDEVLAEAPRADVDFLVRSSVLDELRPDVCDEVLECEDSRARLAALAGQDLFVTPSDITGEAYRVHGLFRDVLQSELRARGDGAERELHARASAAYERRGDGERAVHHAVAAGDAERAADLIWLLAPATITHGRAGTVDRWLALLTRRGGVGAPTGGTGRRVGRARAGRRRARRATAPRSRSVAIRARLLPDGSTLGAMGLLLRATVGLQGLTQSAADLARAEDGITPEGPARVVATYLGGTLAMLHDDHVRAHELLEVAEHQAAGTMPTVYGLVLSQQALLAIAEDRWDLAETLMNRAAAQQRSAGVRAYATQGIVLATRALVLSRAGETEPARQDADQAALNLTLLRFVLPWLGARDAPRAGRRLRGARRAAPGPDARSTRPARPHAAIRRRC